jgi:hypothetical protein
MNPYTKGALFVFRLIAFGFIFFSVAFLFGDVFLWLAHRQPDRPALLVLKGIPCLIGMVIWFKSNAMAKYLTKDLDEE